MVTQTVDLERIESLIQAFDALPLAEQTIIRSRLIHSQSSPKTVQKRSVLEIIAAAHQLTPYRTPEEIDRDIQAERDSWDS
jgi:hypothetical protein